LPSNGHGGDHIEKNSCNNFSIFACMHFGRCLALGRFVTVSWERGRIKRD
jgi:hypothetical protein